jgi:hypothetical protein
MSYCRSMNTSVSMSDIYAKDTEKSLQSSKWYFKSAKSIQTSVSMSK